MYRTDECLLEIKECLDRSWTGMGYKTEEFEAQWKKYSKLNNALFLNSASSALYLAIKTLKIKNNWTYRDEIISTPVTWIASNYAITQNNLKVSFADIDDSLNLDPEAVVKKINHNTKAILFVGIGGNPKNLDIISNIARKNGLKLILDGSHMVGTKLNKEHVGLESDAAIFSFHPTKNLPTSDGGMLCMKTEELHNLSKELSFFGFNKNKSKISYPSFKYNGTSLNASLGIVGLRYLDKDNEYRRNLSQIYDKYLGKYSIPHFGESSRHLYQIKIDNRDLIKKELDKINIQTGIHYECNTNYPPFTNYITPVKSKELSGKILSLPLHLHLGEGDIVLISDSLKKIIREIA